jgi:hypothetical protein
MLCPIGIQKGQVIKALCFCVTTNSNLEFSLGVQCEVNKCDTLLERDQLRSQEASCQATGSPKLKSRGYTRFHLAVCSISLGESQLLFLEVYASCLILPAFGEDRATSGKVAFTQTFN